jgi:hypothetical protein
MDAILSLVTTRLVDFLLGDDLDIDNARQKRRRLRRMSYQKRIDLALMALIYDQPKTSNPMSRWLRTRGVLRVGKVFSLRFIFWLSMVLLILASLSGIASNFFETWKIHLLTGAGAAAALSLLGFYGLSRPADWRSESVGKYA